MPDRSGEHWRLGLRSLPVRITLFVLAATIITSVTVTALSVFSMRSFLRAKIDQKFPEILSSASDKLDLWFDQRRLELGVFASSGVVVDNLGSIRAGVAGARLDRARGEIETYARYVSESSPPYAALFVLDAGGATVASVGQAVALTPTERAAIESRARAQVESSTLYALGSRHKLATAAVVAPDGERIGSLHALLRTDTVEAQLASDDLGPTGAVYVVDGRGQLVLGTAAGGPAAAALAEEADGRVREYEKPNGERMVGAARALERFGWTLVVEESYADAFAPATAAVRRILGLELALALALCAAGAAIARSISHPIRGLAEAASRISHGERDVAIPAIANRDEVGLLARTIASMLARLAASRQEIERSHAEVAAANAQLTADKRELQRANEILEQLSITDGLTKLHNHRFFQDQLVRETRRADRTGEPLALVLIDIDHFKRWNDRLGHAAGDEILRKIAGVLSEATRSSDLLARYGGEEFALLLPNTELDGARALAEKARSLVSGTQLVVAPETEDERLTISAGVALYRGDRKALFTAADEALYRAKSDGRDCVVAEGD
ncbi:MAG: diguanylate cyclase [Myxococcota bacterium]